MAEKLVVAKTEKHLAAEAEAAKISDRAAKIKVLTGKANKDVVLTDIYEQNKLILEFQNEILWLLRNK
ncbi:MAG: hypothetical protein ACOX0E_06670 [Syntrophomonadaceae bacterium]|jgi:hypothetical protein